MLRCIRFGVALYPSVIGLIKQISPYTMVDVTTPTRSPQPAAAGHLDALAPGTRLAEFEVLGLLGVGGFGMVYRGYDHSLHRAVAIKEYMPTSLVGRAEAMAVTVKSANDLSSFESGLRSFIAEARLLARFDHPSLVKVYRFWEANNTAYMAMPLYEGMTLKEARRRMSGPPPQGWLQTVLWSVLAGLKVLHDNNTLHRDVSPDNIFLQNVGPPVLLDLGAARRAIMDTSHKHTAVLKVNYAPIEQYADAKDLQEGPWTDLYAVAAVVHGCICNEPPLPSTFRAVRDRMPPFAQVAQTAQNHFNQLYTEQFVRAIEHGLAIDPTERTASVEVFAKELGMKSPPDLAHFNWRNALGDSVSLTEAGADAPHVQTHAMTTQPAADFADTVFQPTTFDHSPTVDISKVADTTLKSGASPRSAPPQKSRSRSWFWLLPVVVMVLAGGWYFKRPVVEKPAAMAPLPAPAVAANPESATPPASATEVTAKPANTSPSVLAPAVKPSPAGGAAVTAAKAQTAKPAPRSEGKPVEEKAPPVARDPTSICAEASIWTKTICIYRECQKPEFYNLPLCVADRKHWEEQNKGRN